MEFQGKCIKLNFNADSHYFHLIFSSEGNAPNVLGAATLEELATCLKTISANADKAQGLLLSSQKDHFIFGADITEFPQHFKRPKTEMVKWLKEINQLFNQIEDFPFPTVALINGMAFGGGFEICLAADFRLMATTAKVGLLESKLGIIPGWGGTVRLSRLSGADNAIEWIASGNQYGAQEAFKMGAVDGVVESDKLNFAGFNLLERIKQNQWENWKQNRQKKLNPLHLNKVESPMVFETSKAGVLGLTKGHYPAPLKAVEVIQAGSSKQRDEALALESEAFADLTATTVVSSLVQIFLSDQAIKKQAKKLSASAADVKVSAVLGAGIMGGGIAYQSASRGIAVVMKDVKSEALDAGLKEANQLYTKLVEKKKITASQMAEGMQKISPTLEYKGFDEVTFVVEAVVEKESVKSQVLKEVESNTADTTILASNTSTISIGKLAQGLKRPDRFCGMHFFNPVPKMPLVEIIKGPKTSPETVSQAVKFAVQLGKTPIVVNDCPGFLVNRVLFPYFFAFNELVAEGISWARIDKVMEKFGWPMGPAYLLDVVGMDTATHAAKVMAEGFPERMKMIAGNVIELMFASNRLGQKNQQGFYEYKMDPKKGRLNKIFNVEVEASFLKQAQKRSTKLEDQEIVDRMMLPMLFESARCLEEGIVASAMEADAGLLLGLGFPPFRGGIFKYCDDWGITNVIEAGKKWESLGAMYQAPSLLTSMSQGNKKFYSF